MKCINNLFRHLTQWWLDILLPMANSTGRAAASFLARRLRIYVPLVDSKQVRVFHWRIRSNPLRLAQVDLAGILAAWCRHFRYSRATLLSSAFFEALSDHLVHLFTFLKWCHLTLMDELLVCFLLRVIARATAMTNQMCSTKCLKKRSPTCCAHARRSLATSKRFP